MHILIDISPAGQSWKQKKCEKDNRHMLTLGCLWFKTMANSWPSGEKAGTRAPLDLTGWQGGVRRDMEYVLVAQCTLYPTGLEREMRTCYYHDTK